MNSRNQTVTIRDVAIPVRLPAFSRCMGLMEDLRGLAEAGDSALPKMNAMLAEFLIDCPQGEEAFDYLLDLGLSLAEAAQVQEAVIRLVMGRLGVLGEAEEVAKN